MPEENASHKYLSLMLDSVIWVNKKCYPQTLLEECEYEIRKNKMENFINVDFDSSSSDDSDNESNSESDSEPHNESDNDESND